MKRSLMFLLLFASPMLIAQTKPAAKVISNTDLKKLVEEDQRVRLGGSLTAEERSRITRTDADRLSIVKKIIRADQLKTAEDYRNAAIILQHGSTSDDYLLAHTVAVVAAGKGDKTGLWLCAASLDRYLIAIKQPQIYGTQYNHFEQIKPWTQAPYSDDLVTDGIRREFAVPSLLEQQKRLDTYNKQAKAK